MKIMLIKAAIFDPTKGYKSQVMTEPTKARMNSFTVDKMTKSSCIKSRTDQQKNNVRMTQFRDRHVKNIGTNSNS